jgi:hypothetical protein
MIAYSYVLKTCLINQFIQLILLPSQRIRRLIMKNVTLIRRTRHGVNLVSSPEIIQNRMIADFLTLYDSLRDKLFRVHDRLNQVMP